MRSLHILPLVIASDNFVRFPAIGDWGGASPNIVYPGGNRYSQEWGAASMDKLCGERDCDFMLSLGDNFYWDGVYNIDDIRFNGTYEYVYGFASERENIKNLDFYQILGNHDHRRNATAQVIYSHQIETNFKFPDLWYTFTIEKPKFSVKIIMIDTEIMMGNVKKLPEYPDRDYQEEQQQKKSWKTVMMTTAL